MDKKHLETIKEQLCMTAEDICSEAGISLSTYHKIRQGKPVNKNTERHLKDALNRLLLEAAKEQK